MKQSVVILATTGAKAAASVTTAAQFSAPTSMTILPITGITPMISAVHFQLKLLILFMPRQSDLIKRKMLIKS